MGDTKRPKRFTSKCITGIIKIQEDYRFRIVRLTSGWYQTYQGHLRSHVANLFPKWWSSHHRTPPKTITIDAVLSQWQLKQTRKSLLPSRKVWLPVGLYGLALLQQPLSAMGTLQSDTWGALSNAASQQIVHPGLQVPNLYEADLEEVWSFHKSARTSKQTLRLLHLVILEFSEEILAFHFRL